MAMPHKALGKAKLTLNKAAFLPLEQAMQLETSVTAEGFMDPETATRAAAAIAG